MQCSLHGRIECAEKPGAVPLGQRSRSAGIRSELTEVPRDLTTDERVTDIRLRRMFAGRADDARPIFETRAASGISEVTHTSTAKMCSAIQSSAASFGVPGGRIGREPLETTKTLS